MPFKVTGGQPRDSRIHKPASSFHLQICVKMAPIGVLSSLSMLSVKNTLLLILGLWITAKCIYRWCFSPLAKFPGPRFAAATKLYEAYHVAVKKDWYEHLRDLHEIYGIVQPLNAFFSPFSMSCAKAPDDRPQAVSFASAPTSFTAMTTRCVWRITNAQTSRNAPITTVCWVLSLWACPAQISTPRGSPSFNRSSAARLSLNSPTRR